MFTGLVEKVGTLSSLRRTGGNWVLRVTHDPWADPLAEGESVAVQGVCLTVFQGQGREFQCHVLDESLKLTNLSQLRAGAPLNLERALRAGDRMGGHIVSGHVDGTGVVVSRSRAGADWALRVECGPELADGIVLKGSIACDGVSLTVSEVTRNAFEVRIIPYTWDHTSLSAHQAGDTVNLELDPLGKYVRKYMADLAHNAVGLSVEDLIRTGQT